MAQLNSNPHAQLSEFDSDLLGNGFHIFSKSKAKIKGFYPGDFQKCDELSINGLKEGDRVTIRAFFVTQMMPVFKADGGYNDLEVEHIENDVIYGNILTVLPPQFPLAKDTTIELSIDEILKKQSR